MCCIGTYKAEHVCLTKVVYALYVIKFIFLCSFSWIMMNFIQHNFENNIPKASNVYRSVYDVQNCQGWQHCKFSKIEIALVIVALISIVTDILVLCKITYQ